MWFRRKVKSGSQNGHKIGYPTINLNVGNFSDHYSPGVYECEVILDNSSYIGALYFGPKLSHKGNVLEVHIIGYNGHIYGQYVRLKIGQKIREPKQFNDLSELKKQIGKDLEKVV
jgi:riboflavin kinase / FMN adenylyltransferase